MSEKRFSTNGYYINDTFYDGIKWLVNEVEAKEIVDVMNNLDMKARERSKALSKLQKSVDEQQELIEELQASDEMGWKRAEMFEKKCPKELHNKKMYIKRLEYKVQKFKEENEQLRKYNGQLKERLEKINGGYGHLTHRNGLTANEWLIESQERELKKKNEEISDWIERHSKDIAKIGEQKSTISQLEEEKDNMNLFIKQTIEPLLFNCVFELNTIESMSQVELAKKIEDEIIPFIQDFKYLKYESPEEEKQDKSE